MPASPPQPAPSAEGRAFEVSASTDEEDAKMGKHYAAVGTNGKKLLVWGVGHTQDEAASDADRWLGEAGSSLGESDLDFYVISDVQAAAVRAGTCVWDVIRAMGT